MMPMLEQPAYLVMLLVVSLWSGVEELSLEPGQYAGEMVCVMAEDEPGERHAITFTVNEDGQLHRLTTRSPTVEREVEADEPGWQIVERTRWDAEQDFGPDDEDRAGVAPQRMAFEREAAGTLIRLFEPHNEGRNIYVRPNLIVVEIAPEARRSDEPLLTTLTFWPAEASVEDE